MSITLQTPQREQAGSDTYNRYEYQVHWIVCQIISRLNDNPDCVIFCEYHDDMAELSNLSNNVFKYYQIKTKDDGKDWSVVDLSKKAKRRDGSYKHSFLGFIFYNFMQFGSECAHCSFVSNAPMDEDIRMWQACIEDDGILKTEQPKLYNTIKQRLVDEYSTAKLDSFDDIFDRFIQNTSVQTDSLQLNTYEEQTQGRFFNYLRDQKIPTNTANLIFEQILTDVRHKSKEIVQPPISKKSLVAKKGICVADISSMLKRKTNKTDAYDSFSSFLSNCGLSKVKVAEIVSGKITHDIRWNDIEDVNYHVCISTIRPVIFQNQLDGESDIHALLQKCNDVLFANSLSLVALNERLIEVLYYEGKYNREEK